MNKNLLKTVLERKEDVVHLLFTNNQLIIIQKYLNKQVLTNSEKKSLYTSIKKKTEAINKLISSTISNISNEFYIKGNLFPKRVEEAKFIIQAYPGEKVFVAGSFLFSEKYNDIDIYILRERGYKEIHDDDKHIIYLTKKRLQEAIFQSTVLNSVSNYNNYLKYSFKKPTLNELMSLYHEAIIESLEKRVKKESLRDLIFNYYLSKNELIDAVKIKLLISNSTLEKIDFYFEEITKKQFSKTYLYVRFLEYANTLRQILKNLNNKVHIIHYLKLYERIIHQD